MAKFEQSDSTIVAMTAQKAELVQPTSKLFELFLRHTPAAIAVFDRDMRYLAASDRWYSDYELDGEDLIGKCHYDIFPQMQDWRRDRHRRCMEGETFKSEEEYYRRTDGSMVWIKTEMVPWRDDAEDIGGLIVFSEVITEQKKLRDQLQASVDRLNRSELIGETGTWEWTVETDTVTWSPGLEHVVGLGVEDNTDRIGTLDYVHPDDRHIVEDLSRDALAGLKPYDGEWRIVRPDGAIRHVHSKGEIIRDEDGKAVTIIGAMRDITEVKKAQQETRLRDQAIDQSPVSLAVTDMDGVIVYANRAFVSASGVDSKNDAIGINGREFLSDAQLAEDIFASLVRNGEWTGDITVEDADGYPRQYQTIARNVLDEAGNPFRMVASYLDVTEQRQAASQLEQSERRLRQAQQMAQVGSWSYDAVNHTYHIPEDTRAFLGLSEEYESYGPDQARAFIHPKDQDRIEARIMRVLSGEVARSEDQYQFVTSWGGTRHVRVITNAEKDGNGNVIGLNGVIQDVTSIKKIEAARLESERALQSLIDNLPGAVYRCEIDDDWTMRYVSESVESLLGYTPDELIDSRVTSLGTLIHPDDSGRVRDIVQDAVDGGRGFQMSYRIHDRSGRVKWLLEHGTAIYDENGQPIALEGYLTDVTDQQEAVAALESSETRLSAIMQAAPVGIVTMDTNGLIQSVNPAVERIYGYSTDELVGREVFSLYPEKLAAEMKALHRAFDPASKTRYLNTGVHEFAGLRKDGTEFPVQIAMTDYVIGGERRFVNCVLDVTDQKQAEEQLRQAQKLEMVGQLTGGLAHDFNNHLMAIQMNIELLLDRIGGDQEAVEFAESVLSSVGRSAELTGRLLAFSRRQALRPRVVAANQLVTDTARLLRRTLGETICIETDLASDLPQIEADPGQLENALVNLAVNARDAMPGGGRLIVRTGVDHAPVSQDEGGEVGEYVKISVEDDGDGMSDAVMAKVFEPFFTTKEVGKGTGLGLSMVYGFVKQSGGHIELASEVGNGTVIELYFPVAKAALHEPAKAESQTAVPGGHQRIMLVEDDPDVRSTVTTLLRSLGYDVAVAEDGAAALKKLDEGPAPDLLLADVVLPNGMSGRDVAEAVCKAVPDCKVLYMSGYTGTAMAAEGRLEEGVVLLSKPFPRSVLASKISEVLKAG
ncbi:MAG: PAS domain S-box protein [Alphaproteobacteria bacterium]